MTYDPLCTICRSRPKMDRSSCCEECWYSGAYTRAQRSEPPLHALCGERHWNACPMLWGGERAA